MGIQAVEEAWAVIANVSGGDWSMQPPEWKEAARRWRDNYLPTADHPKEQVHARAHALGELTVGLASGADVAYAVAQPNVRVEREVRLGDSEVRTSIEIHCADGDAEALLAAAMGHLERQARQPVARMES